MPAAQVRRQGGAVVAEPAEEDDLPHAGSGGRTSNVLGGGTVDRLEVRRAERVDEVYGDIDAVEGDVERGLVGRVGDEPADRAFVRVRPAGERDDLMPLRELRQKRRSDDTRRTEHRDPHRDPPGRPHEEAATDGAMEGRLQGPVEQTAMEAGAPAREPGMVLAHGYLEHRRVTVSLRDDEPASRMRRERAAEDRVATLGVAGFARDLGAPEVQQRQHSRQHHANPVAVRANLHETAGGALELLPVPAPQLVCALRRRGHKRRAQLDPVDGFERARAEGRFSHDRPADPRLWSRSYHCTISRLSFGGG